MTTKSPSYGYRPYDLLKEITIAFLVVTILTVFLATVFSSPDTKAVSIRQWAAKDTPDFISTAISELNHTSESSTYGPPYNQSKANLRYLGPISLQKLGGVTQPVNPAQDFVLHPLSAIPFEPSLHAALGKYNSSSSQQKTAWLAAFQKQFNLSPQNTLQSSSTKFGPVPLMMSSLLDIAKSGGLGAQLSSTKSFYNTNYTKAILFISDGSYFLNLARAEHLRGSQWGMTNETGNFPGQPWLWLYTFLYQIPPYVNSGNADVMVWATVMALSTILMMIPFIPGLRSLPKYLGIYKLIWRSFYKNHPPSQ